MLTSYGFSFGAHSFPEIYELPCPSQSDANPSQNNFQCPVQNFSCHFQSKMNVQDSMQCAYIR